MKPLLALALIFSLSHAEIEVAELFPGRTLEELEAALVDGYPMPWLAEVLADSTIPEDDRYWLDCRMRAVTPRTCTCSSTEMVIQFTLRLNGSHPAKTTGVRTSW